MGLSRILVFGATGTLGRAIMADGQAQGLEMIGAARRNTTHVCDLTDPASITRVWNAVQPHVAINAAALVDIDACEADPGLAHAVNAHAPGIMAKLARETDTLLVQISTDQFYTGDGMRPHAEDEPVTPVNAYAMSKRAGEILACTAPDHLVIRTNFTGFRGWQNRPTFAEWCVDAIVNDRHVTLFTDYFTSTIDAITLSEAMIDLIDVGARGIVNVASREVFSKADFVQALGVRFGKILPHARLGSVRSLDSLRADSLGLDVSRAEELLGRPLPALADVAHALHRASLAQTESSWTTTRLSA